MIRRCTAPAALTAIALVAPARAAVVISTAVTQNMSCFVGVCAPAAVDATLNVTDLETMLASGNITVTTTGSGVEANDIDVKSPFQWSNASTLALDAHQAITVDKMILVAGDGGFSIATSTRGGSLSFGPSGHIEFQSLSSVLNINSTAFTLVGDIKTLANDIASDSGGAYALAADYDASADGTYSSSPIATTFTGTLQGLGNTISNVSISDASDTSVGFFDEIEGKVVSLRLASLQINASNAVNVGGLAAGADGVVRDDSVTGSITAGATRGGSIGGLAGLGCETVDSSSAAVDISATGGTRAHVGGLIGWSVCDSGSISNSRATGNVTALQNHAAVGGLVGLFSGGSVSTSFATGNVRCGNGCYGGGVVGYMSTLDYKPSVADSYATGDVAGAGGAEIGGLVGYFEGASVNQSYATGSVSGEGKKRRVGGFFGVSFAPCAFCYWDTDTSGTNQGTGYGNSSGISGLTTAQFLARLSKGFKRATWAEAKGKNGGFPYLIANPPPK